MDRLALIPVRSGSKRLPKKNYKLFNSRTLAEIARDKCLASGIFDKVIISSDDPIFEGLVNCKNVEFLLRNQNLANDNATSDAVIDFFFEKFSSCESVLWVNSVSPLQTIHYINILVLEMYLSILIQKMLLKRHKILSLFKDIFIVAWDGKGKLM